MPLAAPVPPVTPVVVQNPFTPAVHDWLTAHRGVDLQASPGQQVVSPRRARVVFTGRIAGRGVVSLQSRGVRFTFEPVVAGVSAGQRLPAGAPIGRIGKGGHCDGRCLHWGALHGRVYVNPMDYLPSRSPVLKPATHSPTCCRRDFRSSNDLL